MSRELDRARHNARVWRAEVGVLRSALAAANGRADGILAASKAISGLAAHADMYRRHREQADGENDELRAALARVARLVTQFRAEADLATDGVSSALLRQNADMLDRAIAREVPQ